MATKTIPDGLVQVRIKRLKNGFLITRRYAKDRRMKVEEVTVKSINKETSLPDMVNPWEVSLS